MCKTLMHLCRFVARHVNEVPEASQGPAAIRTVGCREAARPGEKTAS